MLPDFVVIGVQRGGTTSLYRYLVAHPDVVAAFRKEVHYFDRNFFRPHRWYRAHFPLRRVGGRTVGRPGRVPLSGEASPYYIAHPRVPARLAGLLPEARLIALLRNPVDRAYSQYQMNRRRGQEPCETFEAAIAAEPARLREDLADLPSDRPWSGPAHRHFSYVTRGFYAEQIERWWQHFPRDRMLVLRSEDLYADPGSVLGRVFAWLDLPPFELGAFKRYNARPYEGIAPATRAVLQERFAPHNERLYELLGRDLEWS